MNDSMLSGKDLYRYFKNDPNFALYIYDEFPLEFLDSSRNMIDKKIIILYPGVDNELHKHIDGYSHFNDYLGHYCALFSFNNIMFFNSFGGVPDNVYSKIKMSPKAKKHYTKLIRALYRLQEKEPNLDIEYNPIVYQTKFKNSCGYWCAVRLKQYDLNCKEFYKYIKTCYNTLRQNNIPDNIHYIYYYNI